jgi:[ribosomal protein S18]-alanine N-acetyltransferase
MTGHPADGHPADGPAVDASAGFRIRTMREADLPVVLGIERAVFPEDAWTEEMLAAELAGQGGSRYYVVAVEAPGRASSAAPGAGGNSSEAETAPGGTVAGYAGLFAPGGGQGDVQTIAVRADRQGRGIGSALLSALISEAATRGCREVFLDVRAGNAVARRLYRRTGFTDVGVRRGYYQPSGADAIVMRLKLRPAGQDGTRHG